MMELGIIGEMPWSQTSPILTSMARNLPKNWIPNARVVKLLRPYYDRGFTASDVSTFLIRDEEGRQVNDLKIKTFYLYWRYWKYLDSKKILCSICAHVKIHQKNLERYYLSQYDKLLLVMYGVEKSLEVNDTDYSKKDIDVELETLVLKVMVLESRIRMRKYITENNLTLCYFKFNYSTLLKKTTTTAHKMLIQMLNFISKRMAKKFVLDCQCKSKEPEQTVIKCGICTTKIIPLIHLNFC